MGKKLYGLLGRNISYSFSKKYFTDKFIRENLHCKYKNFDVNTIDDFPKLLNRKIHKLKGFNVTIPYKVDIIQLLDDIDKTAKEINAVNCVKVYNKDKLKGYNTDVYGFENSLTPLLNNTHKKALILGTGGASKAVAFVLNKLKIDFSFVSRNSLDVNQISYKKLDEKTVKEHTVIINCTPLGTSPNTNYYPDIPYNAIGENHFLFDLIYNPDETLFLKKGKEKGAEIKNGLEMLELQAMKSWEIWNE